MINQEKEYFRKMLIRLLVKYNMTERTTEERRTVLKKIYELLAFIKFVSKRIYNDLVTEFRDDLYHIGLTSND